MVTGIILAMNFPVTLPLWMGIVGAFISIVLVKQLFGGLGYNFANPALVGRIALFSGFSSAMTNWKFPAAAVDQLVQRHPLQVADPNALNLMDLFLGVHGGVMGETCALAILIGFVAGCHQDHQPRHPRDLPGHRGGDEPAVRPERDGSAAERRPDVRRRVHGHRLCDQPLHP